MRSHFRGEYPSDWNRIKEHIRWLNGYHCERCGSPDNKDTGNVLTVHHLDGDKSNNAYWNLASLCQRCHLHVQGRVFMPQFYMLEHSEWMMPHVRGYYNAHLTVPDEQG